MKQIKGGVTTAKGFLASGVKAGIKRSGKPDLALLYSEVPAVAAAAFTTNRFKASPVKVSMAHMRSKTHQAVIVNSGNANCANGKTGDRDAIMMASFAATALALRKEEVLVASTGIIGRPLPVINIKEHTPDLIGGLSAAGGSDFAKAIMTTDTVKKEAAVRVRIGGSTVTIGGASKGVGMIYPGLSTKNHATMLCFVTTDAAITKPMLYAALDEAAAGSFNMISVDGDMSTNDTCFIMANGMAGNGRVSSRGKDYRKFSEALGLLTGELARKMVRDGEGATKLVEIEVSGAGSVEDARVVARKISTSNLLKCCIYGEDPNWGRVASAAGASGVWFDPDKVSIYLGGVKALSKGAIARGYDKERARRHFKEDDIHIRVELGSGRCGAKAWTCDFSEEYVKINAEYST
ncbi:MAG: bifunctional glutamate N-acetyltransferase/amino-acid acetyltransferase ArgJ [Candidatus Omnitrophota bacterium]